MAFLRRLVKIFSKPKPTFTPVVTDLGLFAEGDRVLIDGKKLSGPLTPSHRTDLTRGHIVHNDIIGKGNPSVIRSHIGHLYHIKQPSLDEFIALAPRKVTPVYSSYATLIVSLLDIHVAPPTLSNSNSNPLELLEAGTGHGALTLHLARAIHAANPSPPCLPPLPNPTHKSLFSEVEAWSTYSPTRRAILHSVELSPPTSLHAQRLIRSFRSGLYLPHVDFHIAPVSEWITSQLQLRRNSAPFLSHAVLDLPAVHQHMGAVARALRPEGSLVVFAPSVTQIGECVRAVQQQQQPLRDGAEGEGVELELEKVLELGEGISNGRVWDVRLAKRRKAEATSETVEKELGVDEGGGTAVNGGRETRLEEDETVMVCRPKVGRMTIGGGFIGLWKKTSNRR